MMCASTVDRDAELPAVAARAAGWNDIALECLNEMHVPGSLQRCLRILMHVNTDRAAHELTHVYLRGAKALRRDLSEEHDTTEATT